jgi:hypothetical protein
MNALRKLLASIATAFVRPATQYRTFDKYGQPICSRCRAVTSRHYANHPTVECWSCGKAFEPLEPTK